MKKELLILTAIFLTLATPAIAAKDNANKQANEKGPKEKIEKAHKAEKAKRSEVLESNIIKTDESNTTADEPSVIPTVTDSPMTIAEQECNPNFQWKNHGQYVSCVAKLQLGGLVTSQAARSDIGKKDSVPTVTPTLTPTITPTSTASASPTPTDEPPITATAETLVFNPIENIMNFFMKFGNLLTLFRMAE